MSDSPVTPSLLEAASATAGMPDRAYDDNLCTMAGSPASGAPLATLRHGHSRPSRFGTIDRSIVVRGAETAI